MTILRSIAISSINFRMCFVPGILAMLDKDYASRTGVKPKTTTIRAKVRYVECAQHLKVKKTIQKGDILRLFTGLRTKKVRLLGKIICRKTEEIEIKEVVPGVIAIFINGYPLNDIELQKVAEYEGFSSWCKMETWFKKTHGFPFEGQRIFLANTYDRKYYLHKRTKDLGINIKLCRCKKTIEVSPEQVEKARNSKHITELATKHSYGIQIFNPLFK